MEEVGPGQLMVIGWKLQWVGWIEGWVGLVAFCWLHRSCTAWVAQSLLLLLGCHIWHALVGGRQGIGGAWPMLDGHIHRWWGLGEPQRGCAVGEAVGSVGV